MPFVPNTTNTTLKISQPELIETCYCLRQHILGYFLLLFERANSKEFCLEHLLLKVPNVKFDFNVSVDSRHFLADTSKSNSSLGTHLHAMMRTHHFDFDVRFCPISALMLKTNIEYKFDVPYFQWYVSMTASKWIQLLDPLKALPCSRGCCQPQLRGKKPRFGFLLF